MEQHDEHKQMEQHDVKHVIQMLSVRRQQLVQHEHRQLVQHGGQLERHERLVHDGQLGQHDGQLEHEHGLLVHSLRQLR